MFDTLDVEDENEEEYFSCEKCKEYVPESELYNYDGVCEACYYYESDVTDED